MTAAYPSPDATPAGRRVTSRGPASSSPVNGTAHRVSRVTKALEGTTMKVLAIGHLTGKDIAPHLEAEGRKVAELRASGLIRDVFLKADRSGPVLLLNDTSAANAADQLASLPFIEEDLVTFDYIDLNDTSPA